MAEYFPGQLSTHWLTLVRYIERALLIALESFGPIGAESEKALCFLATAACQVETDATLMARPSTTCAVVCDGRRSHGSVGKRARVMCSRGFLSVACTDGLCVRCLQIRFLCTVPLDLQHD